MILPSTFNTGRYIQQSPYIGLTICTVSYLTLVDIVNTFPNHRVLFIYLIANVAKQVVLCRLSVHSLVYLICWVNTHSDRLLFNVLNRLFVYM